MLFGKRLDLVRQPLIRHEPIAAAAGGEGEGDGVDCGETDGDAAGGGCEHDFLFAMKGEGGSMVRRTGDNNLMHLFTTAGIGVVTV